MGVAALETPIGRGGDNSADSRRRAARCNLHLLGAELTQEEDGRIPSAQFIYQNRIFASLLTSSGRESDPNLTRGLTYCQTEPM